MLEKNTSADPVYYCDVLAYVAEHKEARRVRKLERITRATKKRQHIERVLKYIASRRGDYGKLDEGMALQTP